MSFPSYIEVTVADRVIRIINTFHQNLVLPVDFFHLFSASRIIQTMVFNNSTLCKVTEIFIKICLSNRKVSTQSDLLKLLLEPFIRFILFILDRELLIIIP